MIGYRFVAKKVAFAAFTVLVVMTATFVFVSLTPDPNKAYFARAGEEALKEYRQIRNLGAPLYVRYADFLVGLVTLDWGRSFWLHEPVTDLILERLPVTLKYVVPGIGLSAVGGVALGGYLGIRDDATLDDLGTGTAYTVLGMPNFWLAQMLLVVAGLITGAQMSSMEISPAGGLGRGGPEAIGWQFSDPPAILVTTLFPAFVVATSVFASQVRYARSESLEYVATDFVKLVKAQGGGRWLVFKHVLRNATLPILTLFVSDVLAVLVVDVFVIEAAYRLHGIGQLSYFGFLRRDVPVILGTTLFLVLVGVVGNLLTDLGLAALDPRIDDG